MLIKNKYLNLKNERKKISWMKLVVDVILSLLLKALWVIWWQVLFSSVILLHIKYWHTWKSKAVNSLPFKLRSYFLSLPTAMSLLFSLALNQACGFIKLVGMGSKSWCRIGGNQSRMKIYHPSDNLGTVKK